jgi:hypothetical protein
VASASAQDLLPLLQCQTLDPNTNEVIAVFGYVSSFDTTVHIDVGPNNFFSPGVLFRNQPTDFDPGLHLNAFATSFQQSIDQPQITWFLNGAFVVANGASGPSCSQTGMSNTILNGVGAPSDAIGNDGDFYIDTAAEVLYGPKANGHWPATGIPLVGPTGPTSATGATGPRGPQGPPGMPVCRNKLVTILACDALFVPGTWTVGSKPLHAVDTLSRGHVVYARGTGTVAPSGRLAVRLHKLRRVDRGRYTLTVRLTGHGMNVTIRRTVTIR